MCSFTQTKRNTMETKGYVVDKIDSKNKVVWLWIDMAKHSTPFPFDEITFLDFNKCFAKINK